MAETTVEPRERVRKPPRAPRAPLSWGELGPRLVPMLAVITAMLFGGVFMLIAATDWNAAGQAMSAEGVGAFVRQLQPGFAAAGSAYEALVEGATGIGYINPETTRVQRTVLTLVPLGEKAIVFIPSNLIDTVVRAIPFILGGLAVALGFKCGLFNIGAEGQLYAGALLSVYVGFHPALREWPALVHIPLAVAAGILGGMVWGAIPGFLKARTGA